MRRARGLVAAALVGALVAACVAPLAPSVSSAPAPTTASSPPTPSLTPRAVATGSAAPSTSVAASPTALPASSPVPGAEWVPGTHLSILPPPGFVATTDQAGFRDTASDASIRINEVPGGPFDMIDAAFARSGFVVEDREWTTVDGQYHLIVQGVQAMPDTSEVDAILLSLGTDEMSGIVFATMPLDATEMHDAVLASLRTVRLDPGRAIEPGLAIAFDVAPAPPLRLAEMLGQGASYNTLGRPHHPTDAALPTMHFYVRHEAPPGDMAAFLHARLDQNNQQLFREEVQLEAGLIIDGVEGFWVLAYAIDALANEREVFAYQVLLPDPDGDRFVYAVGIATRALQDEILPAFRDTAASFRWRDTP